MNYYNHYGQNENEPARQSGYGYTSGVYYPINNPYTTSQPVQPPASKKSSGKGKKFLAGLALVVSCGVCGFGGGAAATQIFTDGQEEQTVVYKAPADAAAVRDNTTQDATSSVSGVAAKVVQSVVSINTENVVTDLFGGSRILSGAGSGIIISADGILLTNNHVIDGAKNIVVTLPDGSEHSATVIGSDAESDVAVIKINVEGLTPAVVGNSDDLQIGDFCLAVGNPLGRYGGTVTDGIISALNREIVLDGTSMHLLQMSAAVSPGNSGGGLFNAKGELIGLVNAKSGGDGAEGLGFAIPINEALNVAEGLMGLPR